MSLPINKKVFRLTNRISKSFKLLVDNYTFAVTFLFRIREKIRLTFVATLAARVSATINSRRIRLTFLSKLITKITQTISSRKIKLTILPREIKKAVTTILFNTRLTISSKAIQKLVVNMAQARLTLVTSPILAQFFTLGDYDPDTLGTLDTETLGDLDYIAT